VVNALGVASRNPDRSSACPCAAAPCGMGRRCRERVAGSLKSSAARIRFSLGLRVVGPRSGAAEAGLPMNTAPPTNEELLNTARHAGEGAPWGPGGLPGAARQIPRVPRPVVFARLPGAEAGIGPVAEPPRASGHERQQPIGGGPVRTDRR